MPPAGWSGASPGRRHTVGCLQGAALTRQPLLERRGRGLQGRTATANARRRVVAHNPEVTNDEANIAHPLSLGRGLSRGIRQRHVSEATVKGEAVVSLELVGLASRGAIFNGEVKTRAGPAVDDIGPVV